MSSKILIASVALNTPPPKKIPWYFDYKLTERSALPDSLWVTAQWLVTTNTCCCNLRFTLSIL